MRRLPVDTAELAAAMEDHSSAFHWYLDTTTGDVVMLPGEEGDPSAWPEEELEALGRMMEDEPGRLEPVPRIPSHTGYAWMEAFTGSVEDEDLRDLLWVALDGKGAFGRFRRVLSGHPQERERWFAYHDQRVDAELRGWLESLEIEPVERSGGA